MVCQTTLSLTAYSCIVSSFYNHLLGPASMIGSIPGLLPSQTLAFAMLSFPFISWPASLAAWKVSFILLIVFVEVTQVLLDPPKVDKHQSSFRYGRKIV